MSLTLHFVTSTRFAGDIKLGSTPVANETYARLVREMYKQQHPGFEKAIRFELEERDDQHNLIRRTMIP